MSQPKSRHIQEARDFIEVFVSCPLEECERRDPRGLYAKARVGEIPDFTGVSAPYEPPLNPEIVLDTKGESEMESASQVVAFLDEHGYLER